MLAISICGAYGKDLTLIYINHFLIKAGYKVLLVNITKEENIKSIYINNVSIDFEKKDKFEVLEDLYNQYECDVVLIKSSSLDAFLSVIIAGIIRVDNLHPIHVPQEGFLKRNFPLVITTQKESVASELYNTALYSQSPAFVVEHYHISYIKHNIGLDIGYAYQNYTLALTISNIFKEMKPGKGLLQLVKTEGLKRVKPNGSYFFSYPLPTTLPIINNLDFGNYYGKIIKKKNSTFYLDAANNGTAANYITKWFELDCQGKDVIKLCIYYKEPSNDLVHAMLPISTVNYETFYIVDYDTHGNTYDNLRQIFFDDIIVIGDNVPWIETSYYCISAIMHETAYESIRRKYNPKAGHFNVVVDKLPCIQGWISKYSEAHTEADFRVLITGSKRVVDDMSSYLNKNE